MIEKRITGQGNRFGVLTINGNVPGKSDECEGMDMVDAVLFDVDDTLYEPMEPFKRAFAVSFPDAAQSGIAIDELYAASRRHAEVSFKRLQAGEITFLEHNIYRIMTACADFGLNISTEEAVCFQKLYQKEQENIALFPEMASVFEKLSARNILLGVLTNGPAEHQRKKISRLGLAKWIPEENMFVSEEIGYSKPEIEAFRYVERKLGLDVNKTVFIGDSFENDIIGAKNAGWKAIWLNHRRRQMPAGGVVPDETLFYPEALLRSKILFP